MNADATRIKAMLIDLGFHIDPENWSAEELLGKCVDKFPDAKRRDLEIAIKSMMADIEEGDL